MQVTAQKLSASRTLQAVEDLISAASATQPDKLNWEPLENGRSILDQLQECVLANTKWARILRRRVYASLPSEEATLLLAGLATLEEIIPKLRVTATDLASAIEDVPADDLSTEIETEWGPYPLANCCLHAYWNMVYHEGQINYIQTLYGDFTEHY